ncbi:cobalt transporter CbiM [Leptolyngbya sp. O-77]|uniref:cobalt transporter CbiM n=1 Tax=Leptolyngbya sp. O-77 TaxID=1080068 RepID=UPI00074D3E32|nr:cobalt transporter CbiM [Leptolyngbya sp. O-77]BAU40627.1 Fused nickel transport protein NikMN [Leptolyngbya sp. O-77]
MHIPDGILPAPVCIGGYALAAPLLGYALRKINRMPDVTEQIPKASLLTAAFFIASSIHIPIPPASVHLVLNGLLGAVLGYFAVPAIAIGLFLQAVMFGHGGLTTLGVNTVMMGFPALIAAWVFRLRHQFGRRLGARLADLLFAFLAGAIGLGLAAIIFFGLILATIPGGLDAQAERVAVYGLVASHVPLAMIEGVFTAMLVGFLQRVKPELLQDPTRSDSSALQPASQPSKKSTGGRAA